MPNICINTVIKADKMPVPEQGNPGPAGTPAEGPSGEPLTIVCDSYDVYRSDEGHTMLGEVFSMMGPENRIPTHSVSLNPTKLPTEIVRDIRHETANQRYAMKSYKSRYRQEHWAARLAAAMGAGLAGVFITHGNVTLNVFGSITMTISGVGIGTYERDFRRGVTNRIAKLGEMTERLVRLETISVELPKD